MPAWRRSRTFRFGVAIGAVLFVGALRWILTPELGHRAAFQPFVPVILGTMLWLGSAPAIAANVLALVLGCYFAGVYSFSTVALVEAAVFVFETTVIIALGEMINRARSWLSDINARLDQRSKEALQVAEELSLLIDGAHDHAIYMLDPAGRVAIWNRGAERLTGWTESEVLGKHTSVFYPADSAAAGKPDADLARARAEGRFEEEDWRLRKDGREFLASVSTTALIDETGALRGFAKIISDITQRRAAEDTIRAYASHLNSVLSTIPDGMVVIDQAGRVLLFSAAAQALFGYSEDEVVGQNVGMLMTSPDRERHHGYIERYLDTGEARIIGKTRIVLAEKKDGTQFPVELSIGEAKRGPQPIFTGFFRDMTERQRTEERLAELQSELIHVSRVSAMGSMAATLAHELNQPIGAVANYVEAVRDRIEHASPEEIPMLREALQDAAKDALRAGQIVRRMRDFVARGELERSVESLPALIEDAAVLGLTGARERGIQASFNLDADASPVFVDRVQIQQVLINLIRNACEAMCGSVRRRLSVTSCPDRAGFVRVTVADTGPGIAPEIKNQLFTAFVSTKPDGMGLGLSICRTIIEANDGAIWVENRKGGGTSFHFTLPRAQTEEPDVEQ